jgi:hypothetical protein
VFAFHHRWKLQTSTTRLWEVLTVGAWLALSIPGASLAQSPAPAPVKPVVGIAPVAVMGAPRWRELNPVQQASLQPLAATWDTLSDGHRRKWLALAQGYPTWNPEDQGKLHSRMAEWAALSPKDREQARLNFAQTKKIAPEDRSANWDAYQALTPEERKKLADGAPKKAAGAATAPKPVAPQKLADVPLANKAPEGKRTLVSNPDAINRSTLLPIPAELTAVPHSTDPAQ